MRALAGRDQVTRKDLQAKLAEIQALLDAFEASPIQEHSSVLTSSTEPVNVIVCDEPTAYKDLLSLIFEVHGSTIDVVTSVDFVSQPEPQPQRQQPQPQQPHPQLQHVLAIHMTWNTPAFARSLISTFGKRALVGGSADEFGLLCDKIAYQSKFASHFLPTTFIKCDVDIVNFIKDNGAGEHNWIVKTNTMSRGRGIGRSISNKNIEAKLR